jgi:hypothetical protein
VIALLTLENVEEIDMLRTVILPGTQENDAEIVFALNDFALRMLTPGVRSQVELYRV